MDAEADIDAPAARHYGRAALQPAAEAGHRDVVEMLLELGAEGNASPGVTAGPTALQAASSSGHRETAKL